MRPSRLDETVALKIYYRNKLGVMKAIPNVFMTIYQDNPGVIVYSKPGKFETQEIDLR